MQYTYAATFSAGNVDQLLRMSMSTLYRVAGRNGAGIQVDFGRAYSPKRVGGNSLRENIIQAIADTLRNSHGAAADTRLAEIIQNTPVTQDPTFPRRRSNFAPTQSVSPPAPTNEPAPESVTTAPAEPVSDDDAAEVDAIRSILETVKRKGAVDVEQVRLIVREELDKLAPPAPSPSPSATA